jgi:hypothetical protein
MHINETCDVVYLDLNQFMVKPLFVWLVRIYPMSVCVVYEHLILANASVRGWLKSNQMHPCVVG